MRWTHFGRWAAVHGFTTDSTGLVHTIQLMLDTTGDVGGLVEVDNFDHLAAPNNFIDNVGFVADSQLTGFLLFVFEILGEVLNPTWRIGVTPTISAMSRI